MRSGGRPGGGPPAALLPSREALRRGKRAVLDRSAGSFLSRLGQSSVFPRKPSTAVRERKKKEASSILRNSGTGKGEVGAGHPPVENAAEGSSPRPAELGATSRGTCFILRLPVRHSSSKRSCAKKSGGGRSPQGDGFSSPRRKRARPCSTTASFPGRIATRSSRPRKLSTIVAITALVAFRGRRTTVIPQNSRGG